MPRKKCYRTLENHPDALFYKPAGVPLRELEEVVIEPDELEALRLSDLEGMYQEDAAGKMEISRQTFGRIIEGARKKIAGALITGKAIRISEVSEDMRIRFAAPEEGEGWRHRHRHGRGNGHGQAQVRGRKRLLRHRHEDRDEEQKPNHTEE